MLNARSILLASTAIVLLAGCNKQSNDGNSPSLATSPAEAATASKESAAVDHTAASYRALSNADAIALYWSLKGGEPDFEHIAEQLDPDWRRTSDTFKRADILARVKGDIEPRIASAKSARHFTYEAGNVLAHYDATQKAFGLSSAISARNYMIDGGSITIRFTNLSETQIKVDDEALARRIEELVAKNSDALTVRFYLYAEAGLPANSASVQSLSNGPMSDPAGINMWKNTPGIDGALSSRIVRIAVLDENGTEIARSAP